MVTVIPFFRKWIARWPTASALAAADPEEVNQEWAGLGFYRRARMLHEGARKVVSDYGGQVLKLKASLPLFLSSSLPLFLLSLSALD